VFDLLGGEVGLLDEVDQGGSDGAVEDAAEEGAGFMAAAGFAGDARAVEVASAIEVDGDGAFFDEASEEGLDGSWGPFLVGLDPLDGLAGGEGVGVPEDFHDFPFGIGDLGHGGHEGVP